jgi:hypothetical protein
MKKRIVVAGVILLAAGFAEAQMIVLEGVNSLTLTTGDLLDEADHIGRTTNVVEIAGLQITARSGGTTQDVNVTTGSMGIDSDGSGDDSDALEAGEKLILSFNRDLRINQFDFNGVESGEVVNVFIEGMTGLVLEYDDLSNKSRDVLDTNMVVTANTEIEFSVTGSSVIGLDGIDVTVLSGSGDPLLSFLNSNGVSRLSIDFDGPAITNYVLQSCTNLTSNVWSTVSAPIAIDTNWVVETTNSIEFFRAVVD